MTTAKWYMTRALELASLGLGTVSPNPMVGCVIVHQDKIIGEGYHQNFGGPHAEVNAINSVKDKSLLSETTLYVTLEPCNHHGKTPPCTDLIIHHKIPSVVVCNIDPNPIVAGTGIQKLKAAGCEVTLGILENKGNFLNRRFFKVHKKNSPYIILKWAQTYDRFIARENFDSKWISNKYARKIVHKWRTEEDAILVGYNTALHDNPQLNVRDWVGRNPTRIVIDKFHTLPTDLHLFDNSQPTIVLEQLDQVLELKNIQSIIVEGGARTINYFIENNCWDEARVFTSPQTFGKGINAPLLNLSPQKTEQLFEDRLDWYYSEKF